VLYLVIAFPALLGGTFPGARLTRLDMPGFNANQTSPRVKSLPTSRSPIHASRSPSSIKVHTPTDTDALYFS
jgi:hypothetical protein